MVYPIYCINLKERTDRKEDVKKQFKKINIEPSSVIFLDFYKHKKGGIYGCYDSHMKVWNNFYNSDRDKEFCIVFEDDFEAVENSILYLKKAISFIKKNKYNVDILFLHNMFIEYSNNKKSTNNDTYFINGYGFLTHAYVITRKYIKSVLDSNNNQLPKPNGIHFDIDINTNKKSILYSENIYFCKYPIFIQKKISISDNYNNIIDEIIRSKYGNMFIFNLTLKFTKKVRLLLLKNNDDKTKKFAMYLHKLYVL